MLFGVNSGLDLYKLVTAQPEQTVVFNVKQRKPPEQKEKLVPPNPTPRMLNTKLVAKQELLDLVDKAFEDHIKSVLVRNKYQCIGRSREEYAAELTSALLSHTKGNLKLATWLASMAYVESSYRLTADPKISTAKGILQVIYKYHSAELSKAGITRTDLYTNPSKSILAGVLVFSRYLKIEHGDYVLATRRYRGLSVSEAQQRAYLNAIRRKQKEIQLLINQYA